jgi:hypothetical protein
MDFGYKPFNYSDLMSGPGVGKVKPVEVKKKVSKKFDRTKVAKVVSISFPEVVDPESKKYKARFHVGIKFIDTEGKKHHKTIFFGLQTDKEFIDHHSEETKRTTMARLRKCSDVFDKNFYRLYLLNGASTSLGVNYSNLIALLRVQSSSS